MESTRSCVFYSQLQAYRWSDASIHAEAVRPFNYCISICFICQPNPVYWQSVKFNQFRRSSHLLNIHICSYSRDTENSSCIDVLCDIKHLPPPLTFFP